MPDRVVFDHVITALVHGSAYERIATPGCSDRTIRRRLDDWATAGVGQDALRAALTGYDQMIGLELEDLSVDGLACDDQGIPLPPGRGTANDHDSPLLEPTLAGIVDMIGPLPQHRDGAGRDIFPTVDLDRGYDSRTSRDLLDMLGFHGEIAAKGVPVPIQAGRRWPPVERTHSWMNGYGKIRRFTDRRKVIVEFYHCLAAADRHPPPDQPSPQHPPMANPSNDPPTPLTIIRRAL